jgi:uncharacterized membrane protein YbaN (DUF454 family)
MWMLFSVVGIYVLISTIGTVLGLVLALPFVIIRFAFFDHRNRPRAPIP